MADVAPDSSEIVVRLVNFEILKLLNFGHLLGLLRIFLVSTLLECTYNLWIPHTSMLSLRCICRKKSLTSCKL